MPTLPAMLRLVRRRAVFSRRFLAAGAAALIFALSVIAASPALHAWLHGQATLPTDDNCAVVLFAGGVLVPLAAMAIAPPAMVWREMGHAATGEIFLVSPRYLRQPERGPPQLG